MRTFELDPQAPLSRAGLEWLNKDEPRSRNPHVELLLAIGPHLEERRVPISITDNHPNRVLALRQRHFKGVVGGAFDQGASQIRRGSIGAIDPGSVFVLRQDNLGTV